MWLKGRGGIDTLCHGEVAEWLNAAVSKTVTSVIPASGVRIPPSPRREAPRSTLRPYGPPLVSTLRLRLRLSARRLRRLVSFLPFGARPVAHDVPLRVAVALDAHCHAPKRLS